MTRYDDLRRPGRYARDYDAGYGYAPWAAQPYGWGAWGWPAVGSIGFMAPYPVPYSPYAFGGGRPPRRRPDESRAYGRGGDRELRDWAVRRGYDEGYEIRPHRRYDRDWRR